MLKVSLHAGPLSGISQFNQLGRLDIGYDTLAPKATYKAVLFARGEGAMPLARLEGYPRWSGSIWDLVARSVALSLTTREELMPTAEPAERPAYAEELCAVIDHVPRGVERYRSRLGTAVLLKAGRKGCYRASLQEDCFDDRPEVFFTHRPKRLVHWDLLARAINWSLANREHLPARPQLVAPPTRLEGGKEMVALDDLPEPARTGFERWLVAQAYPITAERLALGTSFTEFLLTAV
jgi:hypothetical protein